MQAVFFKLQYESELTWEHVKMQIPGLQCAYSGSFGFVGDPRICISRKHPNGYNITGRNHTWRSIGFFFPKQRVRRRSNFEQWRELSQSGPQWGSVWGSGKLKQSIKKDSGLLGDAETGNQGWQGLVYGQRLKGSVMITLIHFIIFLRIDFSSSIRKVNSNININSDYKGILIFRN